MDTKSPPPCPPTVTFRRNPPRKARATPASAIPLHVHLSSPSLARDLFSTEVCENPNTTEPSPRTLSENLKVYLRIRPLAIQKSSKNVAGSKNAWPKNPNIKSNARPKAKKSCEICVEVNEDLHSVTVSTPQALQETKRVKSEVYGGFSHVFASEASQIDVYEEMVKPLVDDLLNGKSGMLAAMGPSGSGKTHTVFGSAREPGMVPLALRRIFIGKESSGTQLTRVFYMSMFEISSDKKAERMIDLLQDGGDIGMQNSVVKGVQEAVVCDAQQAESLIARGMLKRATAMTNSNSQSSRSQCIINIRCDSERGDKEVDGKTRSTMLTIVDLAGAEREKKTGNQGARLLESNFINNTSMVFGLCLRSLLEYQKSRNKPLQKHYQNSLLTRYMRDYLEGKKRMMLILTVKPGVEDYLDTSFLLRQASPFTKIKFKPMEEQVNLTCNKRPNQALPRAEHIKKMKFNNSESSLIDEKNNDRVLHSKKKVARKVAKDCLTENIDDENLNEIPVLSDKFLELEIREKSSLKSDYCKDDAEKDQQQQIMQGLAKAMWTVLKQFKQKLEVVEIENGHLRDSLANEKSRRLDLENECASQNTRLIDLENELNEFKSQCTCCRKASSDVLPLSSDNASCSLSQHQMAGLQELNSEVSSYSLNKLEQTENEKKTDPSQLEDLLQSSDDGEKAVDVRSISEECSTVTNNSQDLVCYEDLGTVDLTCRSEAAITQLTSSEKDDVNNVGNVKNLEADNDCVSNGSCPATSLESGSAKSLQIDEDLKDAKEDPTKLENGATDGSLSLVEDQIVSVADNLEDVLNSSESPPKDIISLTDKRVNKGEDKLDEVVAILPKEGLDAKNMPKFVPKLAPTPCTNLQHTGKPKRRLLPVSSLLVKDISILDIKDENENPKGGRGGRNMATNEKKRTQGSLSLLNLLTSNR